jgi:hypothetical protein
MIISMLIGDANNNMVLWKGGRLPPTISYFIGIL